MSENHHWSRRTRRADRAEPSFVRGLAGSVFLMGFGGVFLMFLLPPVLEAWDAAGWSEAACTIVAAEMVSDTTDLRTGLDTEKVYGDRYRYTYGFDGSTYQSSRYTFLNPLTSDVDRHQRRLARHPPGSIVPCFVNPDNPRAAVISRAFSWFQLIVLLPLIFALLGVAGLLATLRRALRG